MILTFLKIQFSILKVQKFEKFWRENSNDIHNSHCDVVQKHPWSVTISVFFPIHFTVGFKTDVLRILKIPKRQKETLFCSDSD